MLFKPLRQRLDAQHALRGQRARQLQPYLLVYGELRVMTLEALAVVLLAHLLQRLGIRPFVICEAEDILVRELPDYVLEPNSNGSIPNSAAMSSISRSCEKTAEGRATPR